MTDTIEWKRVLAGSMRGSKSINLHNRMSNKKGGRGCEIVKQHSMGSVN